MTPFKLGINLGFAVKRWPEPQAWAKFIREELDLDSVQFSFDLLDPWWPENTIRSQAAEIRKATLDYGITLHSAFVGLAGYTYNGLLHPDAAVREAMLEWWRRAIFAAGLMGAREVGGPLGGFSITTASDKKQVQQHYQNLMHTVELLAGYAKDAGLAAFLIEPTPLEREYPHTPGQAGELAENLAGKTKIPVKFVLDIGHAGFLPLYGSSAGYRPWFDRIRDRVGMFHLQNTDFLSDSHWGWPEERGKLNLEDYWREIAGNGLQETPVMFEVFYPYEMDDKAVRANLISSVKFIKESIRSFSG